MHQAGTVFKLVGGLRTHEVWQKSGRGRNLEISFESFNLFNRLNYATVNNTLAPDFQAPFNVHSGRTSVLSREGVDSSQHGGGRII